MKRITDRHYAGAPVSLNYGLSTEDALIILANYEDAEQDGRLHYHGPDCAWEQQEIDGDCWNCDACKCVWVLTTSDNPIEHGMKFCPECGAYINSVVVKEYDGDSDIIKKVILRKEGP